MTTITPDKAIVAQVESYKTVIGWSWLEVATRFGWGPRDLNGFKTLKKPLHAEQLEYLEKVADAVASIQLSPVTPDPSVITQAQGITDMHPMPTDRTVTTVARDLPGMTRIAVMTLDDIADKLTKEYFDVAMVDDIDAQELAGARFVVARIAERCGVADQVKALIAARRPPTAMPNLASEPLTVQRANPPPPPTLMREPFPLEDGF